MSMHNHLAALERRHHALDKEIEAERLHPSSTSGRIAELKRKKLVLKDEIERLRSDKAKSLH
jgi:hypothetical protein